VEVPREVIEIVREALATVIMNEEVDAVAVLLSVTRTETVDCPAAVGVPEIVAVFPEPESDSPLGSDPESRVKVFPPDPPEEVIEREYETPLVALNPDKGVVMVRVSEIVNERWEDA